MGDCFSGWHRAKKTVVSDSYCLDANAWHRAGSLKAGEFTRGSLAWTCGGGFAVDYDADTMDPACATARLRYVSLGPSRQEPCSHDYLVRLTTTKPHFGGLRWWFVCPLVVDGQA